MHRFHHWRVRIQDAHDERAIANIIREYRGTITPAMFDLLPEDCRKALEGGDIQDAARKCLEAEMRSRDTPEITAVLHEVAHTYAAAAVRLMGWRAAAR